MSNDERTDGPERLEDQPTHHSLPCKRCGHDLQGLLATGVCPGCSLPVSQSVEKFVAVENCSSQFAAHALVAMLADFNIEAVLADSARSTYHISGYPGLADVTDQRFPVLVRESQLELARLTIEDARADAAELDWDQVDLGERHDKLRLKPVPANPPIWLRIVAIAGITLLALTFAAMGIYMLIKS